ncbi:hypothetical protein ACR79K_25355 [Sphingobacterium siyangense]|uniref:hypothetical protein n=1 Tax=Sphingobacterium siyangense TaxID=459529 RepID=UPI003DA301F2
MKASEARELSARYKDGSLKKEIESIYIQINTEVKKGKFQCTTSKTISKDAIMVLENDGYTVESLYDGRDQTYWHTVKW